MTDKVFILKDQSFDVAASITPAQGGAPAYVTIMMPDRDTYITMRADDFARMASAVANALE